MKRIILPVIGVLCTLMLTGCLKTIEDYKPGAAPRLAAFKIEKSKNPSIDRDIEFQIYDNHNITAYASSDFDLKSLRASFEVVNGTLTVGETVQTSGTTKNNFTEKITYTFTGNNSVKTVYTVHLVPYTGLPVITIRTNSEAELRDKDNWLPAQMTIDGMGQFEGFSDSLYVRGRGNGSWKFPKKPFNAKLYSKSEILGMTKHKRWCFLANYRDRTLLRNDLTLRIGKDADGLEWTPGGEYAEVIFNGKHQGNFFVCEHIRVDKNRVNIHEMTSEDTEGENLTGGYLLELDSYYDEVNKFKSAINRWPVNLKDPDDEVCVPTQLTYIQNYFNEVEQMLHDGEFEKAYEAIDITSFADYYLVQTLAGNTEMGNIFSVFCYKKRNGKLYAGPLWDFDLSSFSKEDGTNNTAAIWYKYLFKDATFKALLKERYALLKPKIDVWVETHVRNRADYLRRSVDENWKQWEIDTKYLYSRLNGDETMTYDAAIDRIIEMYKARLEWLDQTLSKL